MIIQIEDVLGEASLKRNQQFIVTLKDGVMLRSKYIEFSWFPFGGT